jgi:hypothetical protein
MMTLLGLAFRVLEPVQLSLRVLQQVLRRALLPPLVQRHLLLSLVLEQHNIGVNGKSSTSVYESLPEVKLTLFLKSGGQGWTGPTACVSPYVCTYSNAYYSQVSQVLFNFL